MDAIEEWILESNSDCYWKDLLFVALLAFCVITSEPIMIFTCSAPQNDHLNFSFVKDIYVDGEKLARNGRKTTIYILWVSQVRKNIFAFCVITFEPIEIQTCSAPQNDCLNFSFVKDRHGNVEKMARKGGKMVIYESQILRLTLYVLKGRKYSMKSMA